MASATKTGFSRRILCAGCNKPIHIDHFAGVCFSIDGTKHWYCDSLPCLLAFKEDSGFECEPTQELEGGKEAVEKAKPS